MVPARSRFVPTVITLSGEKISWSAPNACYCNECEVLFSCESAFVKHLKRYRGQPRATHLSPEEVGLTLNSRGMWSGSDKLKPVEPEYTFNQAA